MTQRNFANILSGPCAISVDGTDLGHTVGESKLELKPMLRECRTGELGGFLVDLVHLGDEGLLRLNVAEWTLENLEQIYPQGLSSSSGMGIGRKPGVRLSTHAKELRLHPLDLATSDTSRDLVFWKAVATGGVELTLAQGRDRVFAVEFRLLADPSQADGELLGRIGA